MTNWSMKDEALNLIQDECEEYLAFSYADPKMILGNLLANVPDLEQMDREDLPAIVRFECEVYYNA